MGRILLAKAQARRENVRVISRRLERLKDAEFLNFVSSGPFLDQQFVAKKTEPGSEEHGMDTHLIQRDFLYETLAKIYGPDVSPFYQEISKHRFIWIYLFDSGQAYNGTCPENLRESFLKALGLK